MAAVSLGISAWGMVTGVAMVNSGLSVPMALVMSFMVFAGSAQLATLPLLNAGAPLWVIWATALCVNLRFVIFSAQWRPHVMHLPLRQRLVLGYFSGDLTYVLFMKRYQQGRTAASPSVDDGPVHYFAGASALNYLAWQIPSVIGILLADVIPVQWGLGFAGVLALLGLTLSMVNDRATLVSAAVAGGAAVAAFALPYKLNMVAAIATGLTVGLIMERLSPGDGTPRGLRQVEDRQP